MGRWPADAMLSQSEARIVRFEPGLEADFWRLHNQEHGCGWCFCSAWWVPDWQDWAERTTQQNREVRQTLMGAGEYDGYLLYRAEAPIGWCQVGPRDRLTKLIEQFGLTPDAGTWAITCFLIHPDYRRVGYARRLLRGVLEDLPARGAQRVEAFPRRGADLTVKDLWNGPETMFLEAGFEVILDDPTRPILARNLGY